MWTNIVGGLLLVIVGSFAIQWLLPRNLRGRAASRHYLKRDAAPILGFFGLVLLGLSFVEALRGGMIIAWGWGDAVGLVAGIALWITLTYWWSLPVAPTRRNGSALRLAWRIVTTYGLLFLFALLALNIAVRVMGAMLEVFLAGALGMLIIATAVAIFTKSTAPSRQ